MNVNTMQNKIPPGTGRRESALQELAKRELARRLYREYLSYAHDGTWKRTRMSSFLVDEVQRFIEADTGHAYDILVVNCPPQHGKSMTITESLPSWYLGKYPKNNIIMDAAFKGNETSDYVAIQVWGRYGRDYYLRYSLNRHLDFPETLEAIRNITKLYPEARLVLIEEAANGAAVIQTLQRELFVLPVKPKGGKIARVNAVSAAIESGHVFLPDPADAPWVDEYLEQFSTFPNAKHDDMVDSTSQALSFLISGMAGSAAETREQFEEGLTAEEQVFDVYG